MANKKSASPAAISRATGSNTGNTSGNKATYPSGRKFKDYSLTKTPPGQMGRNVK